MTVFERAFHIAHMIQPEGGTCLEFGVYRGATYLWQARQILERYPRSRLIGFDSWQGLPDETSGVWFPERHARGRFASPKEHVLAELHRLTARTDHRFAFVDGFYETSLTEEVREAIRDVIFVNIDVDLHRSTRDVLEFVKPLCKPGVVLYWDDWKDPADDHPGAWGEHRAFSEWLARHDDVKVEVLEANLLDQRSMVVTEAGGLKLQVPLGQIRYRACALGDHDSRRRRKGDLGMGARAHHAVIGLVRRFYARHQ